LAVNGPILTANIILFLETGMSEMSFFLGSSSK